MYKITKQINMTVNVLPCLFIYIYIYFFFFKISSESNSVESLVSYFALIQHKTHALQCIDCREIDFLFIFSHIRSPVHLDWKK